MTSIYQLKGRFQGLLRPWVKGLAGLGVTPNQITILAFLIAILEGGLILVFPSDPLVLLSLPVVLLLRMALNAVDGMLAREHDMTSRLGTILNELTDVLSDAALYLPLSYVPGFRGDLVCLLVVLAVVSEMTGVMGTQIGAGRRNDGPMGKSDRAFVFGTLAFLLGLGTPIEPFVPTVLVGIIVLLGVTIADRARKALGDRSS